MEPSKVKAWTGAKFSERTPGKCTFNFVTGAGPFRKHHQHGSSKAPGEAAKKPHNILVKQSVAAR